MPRSCCELYGLVKGKSPGVKVLWKMKARLLKPILSKAHAHQGSPPPFPAAPGIQLPVILNYSSRGQQQHWVPTSFPWPPKEKSFIAKAAGHFVSNQQWMFRMLRERSDFCAQCATDPSSPCRERFLNQAKRTAICHPERSHIVTVRGETTPRGSGDWVFTPQMVVWVRGGCQTFCAEWICVTLLRSEVG